MVNKGLKSPEETEEEKSRDKNENFNHCKVEIRNR